MPQLIYHPFSRPFVLAIRRVFLYCFSITFLMVNLGWSGLYDNNLQAFTGIAGAQHSDRYSQRSSGGVFVGSSSAPLVQGSHVRVYLGPVGQYLEPQTLLVGFADNSNSAVIRENTSRAIVVQVTMDDGSLTRPAINKLQWEISTAALTAPQVDSWVSAGAVMADTQGWLRGSIWGLESMLTLTIGDVVNRYADWQTNFFTAGEISDETRTHFEASYTNDGVANLVKYALGLDPRARHTGEITNMEISAQQLTLTFNRLARPDLEFTVQGSSDLINWTSVWTAKGSAGPIGSVTINDSVSLTVAPKRFLRLVIDTLPTNN